MSAPSLTNGARRLCTSTPPVPPYIVHPTAFSTSQTSFYKADLLATVLYVPAVLRSENYLSSFYISFSSFLINLSSNVLICYQERVTLSWISRSRSQWGTSSRSWGRSSACTPSRSSRAPTRTPLRSSASQIDIPIFNFLILRCLCLSQRITGSWAVSVSSGRGEQKMSSRSSVWCLCWCQYWKYGKDDIDFVSVTRRSRSDESHLLTYWVTAL